MRRGLAGFVEGVGLPFAGARLVLADRRLIALAALPALLGAFATAAVFAVAWSRGEGWLAAVWPLSAAAGAGVGARAFAAVERLAWWSAWFTMVVVASAGAGWCAGRGLAAPAMDALAGRAMLALGARPAPGTLPFAQRPLSSTALASVLRAVARGLAYLGGAIAIAGLVLLPGGAAMAAPLQVAWAAAWLLADQLLYAFQWVGEGRLSEAVALARREPAPCAGFAAATALGSAVPFAGLLVAPFGVAGACVLVARAQAEPELRGAPEGAVTSAS
jgi:hypothetical protein